MRYLIVSDMHGNWDAFAAVLGEVRQERFDAVLVLGDLVGYGASPNEVVEAVRTSEERIIAVRGNHDKVAVGIEDGASFNELARQAAQWTAETLTRENFDWVRELARGPAEVDDRTAICHGSPLNEDAYVLSAAEAAVVFRVHSAELTFFGHTHIASSFVLRGEELEASLLRGDEGTIELEPGARYLVNPGSVGQPRDGDPRAAYMVYDSERRSIGWWRVPYPVERAQERIVAAGLPRMLADRLALGF